MRTTFLRVRTPSHTDKHSLSAVWSAKNLKKPIAVASSLPSLNQETNVTYSPNGEYVLTGTAGMKAGVLSGGGEEEKANELALGGGLGAGQLVILSSDDLQVVKKICKYVSSLDVLGPLY